MTQSKITNEARERCACHTLQEQLTQLRKEIGVVKQDLSVMQLGQLLFERKSTQASSNKTAPSMAWTDQAAGFEP